MGTEAFGMAGVNHQQEKRCRSPFRWSDEATGQQYGSENAMTSMHRADAGAACPSSAVALLSLSKRQGSVSSLNLPAFLPAVARHFSLLFNTTKKARVSRMTRSSTVSPRFTRDTAVENSLTVETSPRLTSLIRSPSRKPSACAMLP